MENGSHEIPKEIEEEERRFGPAVELLCMDEAEIAHLRERIEKFSGTVRIFVHPGFGAFYDISKPPPEGVPKEDYFEPVSEDEKEIYQKKSSETLRIMAQLLHGSPDKCPPIILMEQELLSAGVIELLSMVNRDSKNEFYSVTTHNDNSSPLIEVGGDDESTRYLGDGDSWNLYLGLLKHLGVKKVILAGGAVNYRNISSEDLEEHGEALNLVLEAYRKQRQSKGARNTDYIPNYCLGSAAVYLSHAFEVDISNLSFPGSLADRRNIEYPKDKPEINSQ